MAFILTKKYLLCFMALALYSSLLAQPVITSISPVSGPLSSVTTITGYGFSNIAADNIVYFGAVKATVISSTPTTINATVPAGSSYEPLTVTVNGLSAYSNEPFIVTFPGAGTDFTKDLFSTRKDFDIAYQDPLGLTSYQFTNVDLDGDGKPEMVSANSVANSISVLRNLSAPGKLSFDLHQDFATGLSPFGIDHGDFDGDGKQDIAVVNSNSNTISVFKNESIPGLINFAPRMDILLDEDYSWDIAAADIDGDGKTDLIAGNINSHNISVFRNTSSGSNISFDTKLNLDNGYGAKSLAIRDMDGDARPDILNVRSDVGRVIILRNTSAPGNILFDPPLSVTTSAGPDNIAVGDLDGDNKPDIATANNQNNNFSVLRNKSSIGAIAFDKKADFFVGIFPHAIAIGDIDGDSRPDIAVSNNNHLGYTVSIYKNIGSTGAIDFGTRIDLITKGAPEGVSIADMDGDGKPEIEVIGGDASVMSVFARCALVDISKQPADSVICVSGNAGFKISTTDTAAYQWQGNSGSGWKDLVNNATYSGVNNNALLVNGITAVMNGYQYRCTVTGKCGSVTSNPAILTVTNPTPPLVTITTVTDTVCQGAVVSFTASPVNGGSAPVYHWKKNLINTGLNGATYIDSTLKDGDIISCSIISNALCRSADSAGSNEIVITVVNQITPGVTISSSLNNICTGTAVSFKAAVSNPGISSVYQWTKNGIGVGTDTSIYLDSVLNTADTIRCTLIAVLKCGVATVLSNAIAITVNPLITPSMAITASSNNICTGTPVIFSSSSQNQGLNPVYAWKKNGMDVGKDTSVYIDSTITEGDMISCLLISNSTSACLTSNVVVSNTITMHLAANLPAPVNLGLDKSFCIGTGITLNAPPGYASYLWQDSLALTALTVNVAGAYYVKVSDACGNISVDTVIVTENAGPIGFLAADTSVCSYEPIELKPAKTYLQYLWSNTATTASININTPGIYWLKVIDDNGCTGSDSIKVASKNCINGVFVPSAFTPNGDGKNDLFKPLVFTAAEAYDFVIFNRYGELIFHSSEPGKGWDGKLNGIPQTAAVYVWKLTYRAEGVTTTRKTGTVTLLR